MADGSKAGMVKTTLGSILATVAAVGIAQAQTGQPPTGTMPGMSGPAGILAKAPATAAGTVTAVNPVQHKVTLDHQAIPALGWPAMKMEFPVAVFVDLEKIKPGTKVQFTMVPGGGAYTIESITAAP